MLPGAVGLIIGGVAVIVKPAIVSVTLPEENPLGATTLISVSLKRGTLAAVVPLNFIIALEASVPKRIPFIDIVSPGNAAFVCAFCEAMELITGGAITVYVPKESTLCVHTCRLTFPDTALDGTCTTI